MDYTEMSVGRKLAKARAMFLKAGTTKSGKNVKLEFKYFELEDILKYAIPIFDRVGLINDMSITLENASARIYNADNMNENPIMFEIPYGYMDQIVSKAGNVVTNNIQALGGSVTYLRRYLWMLILEVIEPDEIDPNFGYEDEAPVKKSAPKPPATPEERAEAKKELTAEENATEEVKALYNKRNNSKALNTAIGYKELFRYFNNEISKEEAIDLIKKNSRHYAKRQYTWFNNQMNIRWFNTNYNNFDNTIEEVVEYIKDQTK